MLTMPEVGTNNIGRITIKLKNKFMEEALFSFKWLFGELHFFIGTGIQRKQGIIEKWKVERPGSLATTKNNSF